ncbi:seleno S [Paramuricea clavata]|uniref:Seleno S n=1 Tax=Paramuricea clavata TaxID=317549 RepID=A0A6S7HPR5_PARCT|nr:seleno S [Paramuricea clavata]
MELSRRRMQETVNARAAEYTEKMNEMDAQKRKEKIDDWENVQKGRGRSRHLVKPDYNPLSGTTSGSSYRPSSRGNTGGG